MSYPNLYQDISAFASSQELADELTTSLKSSIGQEALDDFVKQKSEENVNFQFWWTYMEMVSILLIIFEEYKVFYPTAHPDCLYNIATKDLVTEEIQCLLLNARILGQQQMSEWNNVYKVFLIANRHRKLCRLESGVLRYDSQEQRSNF